MPSPMETLFRTQLSPVPVHTILGFVGSIATAPMDCASVLSKTGLNVVPPLTDFQTPPLAEPTKTVSCPFALAAVTAEMRPLMVADPMFRAGRPEIAPASNRGTVAASAAEAEQKTKVEMRRIMVLEGSCYPPACIRAA